MDRQLYDVLKTVRHIRSIKNSKTHSKATSQKLHAVRRFQERYGEELTPKQYKDMCHMVRSNKATILERQTNRVSKMKINFNGKDIYFCYDHMRHTINTFLKPEWILNPTEQTSVEMEQEIKENE